MNVVYMESEDKYSIKTPTPAKRQKLLSASKEVDAPIQNAMMLVKEVMVMEGPACLSPLTTLSSAVSLVSV